MRPVLALLALVLAGCHSIERLAAKPNPALTRDCSARMRAIRNDAL